MTKAVKIESEGGAVRIELGAAVEIILLGHHWVYRRWSSSGWFEFLTSFTDEGQAEHHNLSARHPIDCPGCREFVPGALELREEAVFVTIFLVPR